MVRLFRVLQPASEDCRHYKNRLTHLIMNICVGSAHETYCQSLFACCRQSFGLASAMLHSRQKDGDLSSIVAVNGSQVAPMAIMLPV